MNVEHTYKYARFLIEEEQKLITSRRAYHPHEMDQQTSKVPWSKILTSIPVWANAVAHFTFYWVWFFVLTELPSYYTDVLGFSLGDSANISILVYVASFPGQIVSGFLSDFLVNRGMSVVNSRRLVLRFLSLFHFVFSMREI